MDARFDPTARDHHLRVLIEDLIRDGKSESEITAAVRRAQDDGGFVLRGRRLRIVR
jgi:hypothetical protein